VQKVKFICTVPYNLSGKLLLDPLTTTMFKISNATANAVKLKNKRNNNCEINMCTSNSDMSNGIRLTAVF